MSVLVTGANGFVASHCVDALLSKGYTTIGTVRSEAKAAPLLEGFAKKYPESKLSFEIVADIAAEGAFDAVLKSHTDIKYILHVASPIFATDAVKVAVAGMENLLNSIKTYAPQVTNLVFTSSSAALTKFPIPEGASKTLNDESWNDLTIEDTEKNPEDFQSIYCLCKKLSEKTAWDFIEKEKPNFKVTTILPAMVYGPQVFDSLAGPDLGLSNQAMSRLITGGEIIPDFIVYMMAIDVTYIANLHVASFEQEVLFNKRLVTPIIETPDQYIVDILNREFPELKLAKGNPGVYPKGDIIVVPSAALSEISMDGPNIEKSIIDVSAQYIRVNKLV